MRDYGATQAARRGRLLLLVLVAGLALGPLAIATRTQAQDDLSGRTATIARSEDGVNFRAEPGFGGEIIGTLADGTVVELRIDVADTVLDDDGETRWWPVRVNGVDGWVAGYYLDQGGETEISADTTTERDETAADDAISGTTASARITSPDGANFRAKPGADGEVLEVLALDTIVELRIDSADTVVMGGVRWWPVRYQGEEGWVAGDYLSDVNDVVVDDSTNDGATTSPNVFHPGEYAAAFTGTGEGVNIRAGSGTEHDRVGFIREGDVIQVMDGPFAAGDSRSGWFLVTDGDVSGYVDGDYLAAASQPPAPADDADPVVKEPVFDPVYFFAGDFAAAGPGGVNVRSGAAMSAGILTTLSTGEVVEVLSGPLYDENGAGWYLVTNDRVTGQVNGNFLVASTAPEPVAPPAPVTGQATGAFIIPVESYVFTQAYGCSIYAFEPYDANIGCNFHNGIDLAAAANTTLMAADGGIVKYAGWCDCGLGYFVEIDHGNGFATVYGHMNSFYVSTGDAVYQGQPIGAMGSTGLSTGPHVHFMIKLNGSTVDPLGYLPPV